MSTPHEAHLKNQGVAFIKKDKKCGKIAFFFFFFFTETADDIRTSTIGRLYILNIQ